MYSRLVIGALVIFTLILTAYAVKVEYKWLLRRHYYICPKLPRGCICFRDEYEEPDITRCRGLNHDGVKTMFDRNRLYDFINIDIIRSNLDNASMFTNLKVKELELRFCQIRNFNLLENLGSLKKLNKLVIESVAMERITFNPASMDEELSKLEEFVLLDCPEGCEDGSKKIIEYLPRSLSSIKIQWCRLTLGEDNSFRIFPNLTRLQLNQNRLTTFKRSYLPEPASLLTFLSLSKNPITSLPEDMFSDMPLLSTIELAEMELTVLQYDVFKPLLNQKKLIKLAHNPIICNCHNSWIIAEFANWNGSIPICASPGVFKGRRMNDFIPMEMCRQIPGENFQETLEQYCEEKFKVI